MEALSQSFRALGDATRLRLLRLLGEAPLNVSELVSLVGVAQSSVSHHLAKLKAMGLLREERQSGFTFYRLAIDPSDARWPMISLAQAAPDEAGDRARLGELLLQRRDRQALNERLLEPGQSWSLWADALASLLPPLEVADFGCGTGELSVSIARWARRVWAVDQSAEALAEARARAEAAGLGNVSFLEENLETLSLATASVDLVVISQSLHHVVRPEAVLSEAARILAPGGRVVVLELEPHDERWVLERLGHRHLGFSPDQVISWLEQQGFERLSSESHARGRESKFRVYRVTGVRQR